jgi:MYXO-CTERM domain-containing protein
MQRLGVIALALGVIAAACGVSAGTGPLAGGLAALVLAGLALRARSAEYIVVWAVVPLLVWATYPDPSMIVAAVALTASAICALLAARERTESASESVIAARITLAAAMVLTAGGLLSFDLLLR